MIKYKELIGELKDGEILYFKSHLKLIKIWKA